MKDFNIKQYHQAYHPYNIPHNNQQQQQHQNQQQQQHLQNSSINFLNPYNNTLVATPTANQRFHSNQNIYNLPTSIATTTTTAANINTIGGKTATEEISINNNHQNLIQTSLPAPPTLGGYLANQQQQRLQQQQQQKFNMLSLNQANTFNYNFHFNANNNSNGNNLHMNVNNRSINHTDNNNNNNNNSGNKNTNNNHNNSALLSRPQRPNSLNISAMASLAPTPPSCSYSLTCSSNESPSETNSAGGYSFTPNHFFNNQRENIFNFPTTQPTPQQQQQQQHHTNNNNNSNNFHNYLQQQQQQYQINYNNYQSHQQQQQHQQHLQQFQLLQQQLKQQQQQQMQLNNNNNNTVTPSITLTSSLSLPSLTSLSSVSNSSNATTFSNPGTVVRNASNNTSNAIASGVTLNSNQTNNNNNTNNNSNNNNNTNNNTNNNCDKLSMDACEIANFLANELFMQQLVSMECMQTGVPTLTTPTLTPTTLKSIEESFIQLTSEPINVPYQAGFIPPPLGSYNASSTTTTNAITANNDNSTLTTAVPGISPNTTTTLNNVYLGDISAGASLPDYGAHTNDTESENSQGSWTGNHLNEENSMATTDTSSAATDSFQNGLNGLGVNALNNSNSSTTNDFTTVQLAALAVATAAKMSNAGNHNNNNTSTSATANTATPTRRGGGRRPATNSNMSPEEEEKRRIRRERNKLAAARCRKRRVDQTNELTLEVEKLEKKREELHKEIESLKGTKQDLEFLLDAHRPTCQRVVAQDILSNNTFEGLMPTASSLANDNITGLDTSLATTARCISPLDLKPVLNDQLLAQIKAEPLDSALDSNSSLDQDGPPSPKRLLLTNNNPMIPPPLPNVATLSASLAAASASLNTPIVTTAPVSFSSMYSNNPTLSSSITRPNSKQRPNSLPTVPRNLAQNLGLNINDNKPPTDINGVAIQTPSTGMFNFESLMDGGTGLTPVSNPLVPNCSSQNKHPLELVTPTSEPSKLVSL